VDVCKRYALHVRAQIAGANELDISNVSGDVVAHRALGHHQHPLRALILDEALHLRRGTDEIGSIQPVAKIARICREREVLFHSDASQAIGKTPLDVAADAIDLHALLLHLGELEINEVLTETGATLSGSMLRSGLIDEMVIYMAPTLMGTKARGLFTLPGLDYMEDRIHVEITDMRAVGQDWRMTAKLKT